MKLNFKTWMLIENPDTVIIKPKGLSLEKKTLNWRNGQTFSLFDSYFLISLKGVGVIHEAISHRINECQLAIEALMRKEITPQELSDCLTSPSRKDGSVFLTSKGEISNKSVELMIKAVEMSRTAQQNKANLKDLTKRPQFVSYRVMSLKDTPEVMLGRIWSDDKVISFWNNPESIFNQSGNILKFISEFGKPAEYSYEIHNMILNYEEFIQKKMPAKPSEETSKPNFDPSVVHAMAPGEVKSQLQRMMGMTPGKHIDIRNKQLAYTSENSMFSEMPLISLQGKTAFADQDKLKDVNVETISNNIVMFRQPETEEMSFVAPGTTWVYFMDSEESAQKIKSGEIPMIMVPKGTSMSGGNPITDIWKKRFQKPGTEHILGVIEGKTNKDEIYIDMMTVRPGYKRNSINSKMIQYIQKAFPTAKLSYSSPTNDGEKFIKGFK